MRRGLGVLGWGWMLCLALGCGPVAPVESTCAPELGQDCASGQVCVEGLCVEAWETGEKCVAGAKRACEEGCAGVQTCESDGTWGACRTCEQGQRCAGNQCVCDPNSCRDGCCQGNTCVPGTADSACGRSGAACASCAGVCDASRKVCAGCVEDSQCGGPTPRCDTRLGTCVCSKSEQAESLCTDGRDNDCDGRVDCADPDCNARSCRAAAGVCDQEEVCTGGVCPADKRIGNDIVCRPSRGACDVEERCDGQRTACPADGKAAAGRVCNPSAGACDPAELCDGVNSTCPANGYHPSGSVCRATRGDCDVAEKCTGSSPTCPGDATDSSLCDDGKACTTDTCGTDGMCRYIQISVCR
ncbi:hypothetical protein [Archangium sp.]|uniref:hypothetical protein n=1 Tax=Archangium sp. TaxID=1872627 RepID=UPI00286CFD3C|nr:hypothetical protein [Archangium sp.]